MFVLGSLCLIIKDDCVFFMYEVIVIEGMNVNLDMILSWNVFVIMLLEDFCLIFWGLFLLYYF